MRNNPDYHYHVDRARTEMDCAYRAQSHAAAAAHMRLSALHMDRARLAKAAGQEETRFQVRAGGAPSAA